MSFLAKLFINGRRINVLDTDIHFDQNIDPYTFKPTSLPQGGIFTVTVEADGTTDILALALARDTMCSGYIRFYNRGGMSKLTDYEFFDTYVVSCQRNYDDLSTAKDTYVFSPGILRIGDMVFEKPWKITDLSNLTNNITPEPIVPKPKLASVKWKTVEGETIEETTYQEKVALEVKVANAEGGSVEITIEKEDGTEFEEGTKSLTFTEYLTDEGTVQISSLKIKEEWDEFRSSETDGLIAKVSHKGSKKESNVLQIITPPKVIVDFRPSKNYDGEYGFDFMRDKKDKDDKLTYKDILGTNKSIKGVNKFTKYKTDTKYKELKCDIYDTIPIDWHKNPDGSAYEYIQSWLTIYPKETQILSLQIETIKNPKKLDLTFEYDKTLFKLNTDKIPAQSKGKKRLDDHLTIECIKEFSTDQVIKAMCQKRQLGQLNILKNDKANRKKAQVVFVKVETELNSGKPKFGNTTNKTGKPEKEMLARYLKQAYTKLELDEIDFKLTELDSTTKKPKYPDFNKNYTLLDLNGKKILNKYHNKGGNSLAEYMEKTLNKELPKYKDYFKVFFFGDTGGRTDKVVKIVKLAGYANGFNSQSAIMFVGKRKATVTHELLHCMGLRHSFDNSATFSYKKKATQNIMDYSATRTNTWLWQWKKLWKNKDLRKE
ncbi:type VI secretion system tube protein TssD [Zobellia galactanivorans]|uniref:Uncharacterized protein n=1 Tax=Zobellia galactanivorans (strain DSM 12802 / CCUG 47099 / CIP 106680 / NCIMB 13871 / Dsij) TaxID=63186 RepID=G0L897_ZOBGA|nr:type VI secretion system tube protein TssD [Zobellia galactanivorans]CAZ98057.1 Conserved hypothetical protein [Zobellia galactanivorans]